MGPPLQTESLQAALEGAPEKVFIAQNWSWDPLPGEGAENESGKEAAHE